MIGVLRISLLTVLISLLASCAKDVPFSTEDGVLPEFKPTPFHFPPRQTGYPHVVQIPDNPYTEEGIALGRFLFYDPILSADSTQSCSSCHLQENGFSDPRQFSIGITGAVGKRNSMALFNLMWHPSFFWDGRSPNIRDQVVHPIEDPTEMNSSMEEALQKLNNSSFYRQKFYAAFGSTEITRLNYTKAMEQFLFSIISFNSEYDKWFRGEESNFSQAAFRGLSIFFKEPHEGGADCFHCHGNIQFADFSMSNNGLDEEHSKDKGLGALTGKSFDEGKFKVVSLRNIELTAPYMHDGRFKTLEEIIDFYSEGIHANSPNIDPKMDQLPQGLFLDAQQKSDLIAFLKSLTDTELTQNKRFSNPFK